MPKTAQEWATEIRMACGMVSTIPTSVSIEATSGTVQAFVIDPVEAPEPSGPVYFLSGLMLIGALIRLQKAKLAGVQETRNTSNSFRP